MLRNVGEERCREVLRRALSRSVGEESCRQVLKKSVVEKYWGGVLKRSVWRRVLELRHASFCSRRCIRACGCFQVFIFMSLGFDVCMSGFVCIEFMFKSIFILMPLCFDL